jgi:hypothetical protein
MMIKFNFNNYEKFKIKFFAFFKFIWNKKLWIFFLIIFIFVFFSLYIYFYIKPSVYISPNLFTDSGKAFISACINTSKLSSRLTIQEKQQIVNLVEDIFYQMSKKGTPFQIGIRLYFYKFKFIIKVLWEVIEIKKNNSQSIPDERIQMIASRIVEELLNYSRKNPTSKLSQLIFYYYKKLILNLNSLYFF